MLAVLKRRGHTHHAGPPGEAPGFGGGEQIGLSPVGQEVKSRWGLWLGALLHKSHVLAETQGWYRHQQWWLLVWPLTSQCQIPKSRISRTIVTAAGTTSSLGVLFLWPSVTLMRFTLQDYISCCLLEVASPDPGCSLDLLFFGPFWFLSLQARPCFHYTRRKIFTLSRFSPFLVHRRAAPFYR